MCLVWRQRRQGLQPAFSQVPAGELTGASGDQTHWQSKGDCWRKQDNDLQLCEQCKQHTSAGFAQRVAVVKDLSATEPDGRLFFFFRFRHNPEQGVIGLGIIMSARIRANFAVPRQRRNDTHKHKVTDQRQPHWRRERQRRGVCITDSESRGEP